MIHHHGLELKRRAVLGRAYEISTLSKSPTTIFLLHDFSTLIVHRCQRWLEPYLIWQYFGFLHWPLVSVFLNIVDLFQLEWVLRGRLPGRGFDFDGQFLLRVWDGDFNLSLKGHILILIFVIVIYLCQDFVHSRIQVGCILVGLQLVRGAERGHA